MDAFILFNCYILKFEYRSMNDFASVKAGNIT